MAPSLALYKKSKSVTCSLKNSKRVTHSLKKSEERIKERKIQEKRVSCSLKRAKEWNPYFSYLNSLLNNDFLFKKEGKTANCSSSLFLPFWKHHLEQFAPSLFQKREIRSGSLSHSWNIQFYLPINYICWKKAFKVLKIDIMQLQGVVKTVLGSV